MQTFNMFKSLVIIFLTLSLSWIANLQSIWTDNCHKLHDIDLFSVCWKPTPEVIFHLFVLLFFVPLKNICTLAKVFQVLPTFARSVEWYQFWIWIYACNRIGDILIKLSNLVTFILMHHLCWHARAKVYVLIKWGYSLWIWHLCTVNKPFIL